MARKIVSKGAVHKLPMDLRKAIFSVQNLLNVWEDITPLARNEWICWVMSAKKIETRNHRIQRVCEDLMNGKRRPCCWAGCIHR